MRASLTDGNATQANSGKQDVQAIKEEFLNVFFVLTHGLTVLRPAHASFLAFTGKTCLFLRHEPLSAPVPISAPPAEASRRPGSGRAPRTHSVQPGYSFPGPVHKSPRTRSYPPRSIRLPPAPSRRSGPPDVPGPASPPRTKSGRSPKSPAHSRRSAPADIRHRR